jgi:2-keto-3-deoxy-L-rhamnonate aldolase RhmA
MRFENHLKRKLAAGESTVGMWITQEAPSLVEIAAEMGFDWVVLDTEHGHLDFTELVHHLRALRGSTTSALVRIPELGEGAIKRALDLGAHGVIIPQVRDGADVQEAVRHVKYPPWGTRGVGGERTVAWGLRFEEYLSVANDETMVVPLVEHVNAAANLDEMLEVPGVDAIFLGPADFSSSAGHLGQWEGPGVAEALLDICARCEARGIPCGVMGTSDENALQRRDQGFRLVGLGSDTGLLIRAAKRGLALLRG